MHRHSTVALITVLAITVPLLAACDGNQEAADLADMPAENEPSDADLETRTSASEDPLAGTSWLLIEIEGGTPPLDTAASIEFQDGRLGGSTGCNRYNSSYELGADEEISIGMAAMTMMACPPPQMELEQQFTGALANVTGFRMEENQLALTDTGDNAVLVFALASNED